MNHYDVLIIGAGPAGCACALALKDSGLSIALVDKSGFPRDKVCGDAIPGRAVKVLGQISPQLADKFKIFPKKLSINKTACYFNGKELEFEWKSEAYTCTRLEFDHFLLKMVSEETSAHISSGIQIEEIIPTERGYIVKDKIGTKIFSASTLVGADGVNGISARKLTGRSIDRNHHVGAVRAYFENVSNLKMNRMEIYLDKDYLPGYLWMFPIGGDQVNIGFGMLSKDISTRKANIKELFHRFISSSEALKGKLRNAVMTGALEGCGIPLGSRKVSMSGNRFLLCGDAASLVDPAGGEGIGNAMMSGKLAALQIANCFEQNDFSPDIMSNYDRSIQSAIGHELKWRWHIQKLFVKAPFLLDLVFRAGQIKFIKEKIRRQM